MPPDRAPFEHGYAWKHMDHKGHTWHQFFRFFRDYRSADQQFIRSLVQILASPTGSVPDFWKPLKALVFLKNNQLSLSILYQILYHFKVFFGFFTQFESLFGILLALRSLTNTSFLVKSTRQASIVCCDICTGLGILEARNVSPD